MPTHGTNKKPAHEKKHVYNTINGLAVNVSLTETLRPLQNGHDVEQLMYLHWNKSLSVCCIDWLTRRLHYHNCTDTGRPHRMYCNGLSWVDHRRMSAWMPSLLRWNNWKPTIDLLMLALEKPRPHQQIGWKECRLHRAGLAEENRQWSEWLPRCHVIRKLDVWTCNFWMYTYEIPSG